MGRKEERGRRKSFFFFFSFLLTQRTDMNFPALDHCSIGTVAGHCFFFSFFLDLPTVISFRLASKHVLDMRYEVRG